VSTAFENVVVEALHPEAQARWWADALGWSESYRDEDEIDIDAPDGSLRLAFLPVPQLPEAPGRLHLDLASRDADHQRSQVSRLLAAGARRADIGQRDVPWQVLADPEGMLFCVLEPRPVYADVGAVAAVVLQAADPESLAGFWAAATGWQRSDTGLVALRRPAAGPFLEFSPVRSLASGSGHRVHLDVRPLPGSLQDDEVARLRGLGAAPLDVGQRDVPWVVLSDPEGNPFCVLSAPA
jgi:Glyoxalase-like domain